jgi:hypothetical protein
MQCQNDPPNSYGRTTKKLDHPSGRRTRVQIQHYLKNNLKYNVASYPMVLHVTYTRGPYRLLYHLVPWYHFGTMVPMVLVPVAPECLYFKLFLRYVIFVRTRVRTRLYARTYYVRTYTVYVRTMVRTAFYADNAHLCPCCT